MKTLNKFLNKYKSELNKFSKEIYKLELENKKELEHQAISSFRNEMSIIPKNVNHLELLIIQFLINELGQYDYVDYEDIMKDLNLEKELNELNKYF